MDFLTLKAMENVLDSLSSDIDDVIKKFRGKRDDSALGKAIRQKLLERYGNELFYNDLDFYLSSNKTIENLICTLRHSSLQQFTGPSEFVTKNSEQLISGTSSCLVCSSQIKDVFSFIFECTFAAITSINPYSEFGQLQSDLHVHHAENSSEHQAIFSSLSRLEKAVSLLQNEGVSHSLPDFSEKAEEFRIKIKEIEKTYQHENRFEEALTQYGSLALSIADAEIRGEAKSALLCALRCNIALCHSNLGNLGEAMDALGKIPSDIAQGSELFHFVWAIIVVQHRIEDQYSIALNRLETALDLKSDYHRAFFFRQYLQALIGTKDLNELIDELDSYFDKIPNEEQKEMLTGEYYSFRGLIYTAFKYPDVAYENYEKAIAHGYNEFVSRFNRLSSLYGQAIKDAPNKQRTLHPNVDIPKLYQVLDELKVLLHDERMDAKVYQDVKCYAVSLYVSASNVIKGSHDLQPLKSFLPFSKDYETTRMLILGSKDLLTPDTIELLDQNDQFLLEVRQLLHDNEPQKCRKKIEEHIADSSNSLPPDVIVTLLQLCVISNDLESYHKYRNAEDLEAFAGDFLTSMDACVYELEGNIEKALLVFSDIAQTSTDYHALHNALRFFRHSNHFQECESLYLRLQVLQKEQKTYIDDLDNFYCNGLYFLLSHQRSSAKGFFEAAPKDELSLKAYSYMEKQFYQAINDPPHLYCALSKNLYDEFQDKMNQAICQRLMCHYDDGLTICLDLVERAVEIEKEQLVKVYWLISDFYLFKGMLEDSYSWALKAHELMKESPYDQSHSAFLGRIVRTGHFEGLSTILEYQKTHPVVINFIKAFQISQDEKDLPKKLLQEIDEYLPDAPDYDAQEQQLAVDYKSLPIPIHLLLQHFDEDWGRTLSFAQKNKLRLGTGDLQRQRLEETWIGSDLVVDAQTLIILTACGCLPALRIFEYVHISYSAVAIIQNCYLTNNYGFTAIQTLMDWLNSKKGIILEPDGIINVNENFVEGFSRDFFIGCNIAERLNIPFLCSDVLVISLQEMMNSPVSNRIHFVTLPVLCNVCGKNQSDLSDEMLYNLMQYGKFISFSAKTMISQIKRHNFQISEELLRPFLTCKSDYNMQSFSSVYLEAISMLKEENEWAAIELSKIVLSNATQIWRRGTYYRETLKTLREISKILPDNSDKYARAVSIFEYSRSIVAGVSGIWPEIPAQISHLFNNLKDIIVAEAIREGHSLMYRSAFSPSLLNPHFENQLQQKKDKL